MASVRNLKKDIDFLFEEVISDCYLAAYFHPEKAKDFSDIVDKAIILHRGLILRANNPAEKNNPSLVRKHYAQLRKDLMTGVDDMFARISEGCKKK